MIQNILLFVLALPVHSAIQQTSTSLALSDLLLFAFGIAVHVIEFTADNQHQSFHKFKQTGHIDPNEWLGARIQWVPADAKRGFVTRGLWAWSRHPNFLCEQLCWVCAIRPRHLLANHDLDRRQHVPSFLPRLAPPNSTVHVLGNRVLGPRSFPRALFPLHQFDLVHRIYNFGQV